jgi:hypothetical protein
MTVDNNTANDTANTATAQMEADARAALLAGQPERAEPLLRQLLADGTGPLPLWNLLVASLRIQGRTHEARAIQEMLVEAVPGNLTLRYDLAETLLLQGDFDRGWREYHYRYSLNHTAHMDRKVQRPVWNGKAISGKTLLIHDEQGYGDTFQFIRLVSWVKQRSGARILLQIRPEQAGFARRMADIDKVVLHDMPPPPFDLHCQMMSLPRAMRLQLSDLPGTVPYLSVDQSRVGKWRKRLQHLPRPLVALVWAGSETHLNDAHRSVSLAALAPLATANVSFVSIQKGSRSAQAANPPPGMALTDLSRDIRDFEDTAAILSICDLLISIDSAPVHLAGALGRPTWVLLPFVPDWRWLLDRDDSPWYPGMRLYRQPERGNWRAVIARMAADLAGLRT